MNPTPTSLSEGTGAFRTAFRMAPGGKRRYTALRGRTLAAKFVNHFNRRLGFDSPLSHLFSRNFNY